jgi:hypothetical protein
VPGAGAGVASNTLEALITRALLEPVINAALRRRAGRLANFQRDPLAVANVNPTALRAW